MKQADALDILVGSFWHTTNEDRFKKMLIQQAILPEPDLPDSERWGTAGGPDKYPYVRTLGGVSLFDFREFYPTEYDLEWPLSNWAHFVPYREAWGSAVWIEIDFNACGRLFISAAQLRQKWRDTHATNRFMPMIEGAYIGELTSDKWKRALLFTPTELAPISLEMK